MIQDRRLSFAVALFMMILAASQYKVIDAQAAGTLMLGLLTWLLGLFTENDAGKKPPSKPPE